MRLQKSWRIIRDVERDETRLDIRFRPVQPAIQLPSLPPLLSFLCGNQFVILSSRTLRSANGPTSNQPTSISPTFPRPVAHHAWLPALHRYSPPSSAFLSSVYPSEPLFFFHQALPHSLTFLGLVAHLSLQKRLSGLWAIRPSRADRQPNRFTERRLQCALESAHCTGLFGVCSMYIRSKRSRHLRRFSSLASHAFKVQRPVTPLPLDPTVPSPS